MKLPQRDERHLFRGERTKQALAIFDDAATGIPIGEAEIQDTPSIQIAYAAGPRAEAVDEPRYFFERRGLKNPHAAFGSLSPKR